MTRTLAIAAGLFLAGAATAEPDHWSFRPVARPAPPVVDEADDPIDAFILARLRAEGLPPPAAADRATLLNRAALDLTGLPPSPGEIDSFLLDESPDAYERRIDRLLASAGYGERWGRHWLDAARYADSDGYEKDGGRPFAWRWRDWVIGAFNADLPFDRFTREQLAGDLMPDGGVSAHVATGFHRNTLKNREGGVDAEEFRVAEVADRVNTTAQVWLGLTLGCAQCHDHKYDPISQREYFQIFAFFNSDREVEIDAPTPGTVTRDPLQKAAVMRLGPARKTHIHERGDFQQPADEVSPGTPDVLPRLRATADPTRLDLADWIVADENPLTRRVIVNWAWEKFFGRGLVSTLEDFGRRGARPTHPELLDWLATEFRRRDWSLKSWQREVVTSAAYRRSSAVSPEHLERDPDNALLSRQRRIRLEAEVIRDRALAAAGLLTRAVGGPSVRPPQPGGISELTYANSAKWTESSGADRYRRGLYVWFQRTSPFPMLMTFDSPDSNVCQVRRERSNTPLQALTLLNDAVFVESARALGRRILDEEYGGDRSKARRGFRLALGREPTGPEAERLEALAGELRRLAEADPKAAADLVGDYKPDGIPMTEAATWVAVARVVLNLDEFVNRE